MTSQFTAFTCTLDLISGYLRELGLSVFTSDIITNHRDLCLPNQDIERRHQFGALASDYIEILAFRYLLGVDKFTIDNIPDIAEQISFGNCIIVICSKFRGKDNSHAIRIVGIDNDFYIFDSPAFPHSKPLEREHSSKIFGEWVGEGFILKRV